jgi:hypothetical protein
MGLGALGVDLLADTDHASVRVTANAAVLIRQSVRALIPVGFAGKGAEIITQFVAPGLGGSECC